ncbi:hypothetical protein U9M48_000590 [Paspalum notatum var. saurae]|uniref:Uncharacterized protein n=1 Tax=Paspalum notatum var. saurae TaxID=547442 RepID=A0AAQ3PKF7_PASNO
MPVAPLAPHPRPIPAPAILALDTTPRDGPPPHPHLPGPRVHAGPTITALIAAAPIPDPPPPAIRAQDDCRLASGTPLRPSRRLPREGTLFLLPCSGAPATSLAGIAAEVVDPRPLLPDLKPRLPDLVEVVAYKVEVRVLRGVALVQRWPPCQELMLKPHRRCMLLQHPSSCNTLQHLAKAPPACSALEEACLCLTNEAGGQALAAAHGMAPSISTNHLNRRGLRLHAQNLSHISQTRECPATPAPPMADALYGQHRHLKPCEMP